MGLKQMFVLRRMLQGPKEESIDVTEGGHPVGLNLHANCPPQLFCDKYTVPKGNTCVLKVIITDSNIY